MNNKPEARKNTQPPPQKLRTEVMKPTSIDYSVWVPSFGVVKPKTQSLVIAQVSGQVVEVSDKFRDGAFFEKGDTLLIIDDADYLAQLTIAQAELKQNEFTYKDEKARSELAIKEWYKLGNTKEPPSLVAREPQLNSSLSGLEASKAKVVQAQLNLQRSKIIAPFAGRVLKLDVNVGQVVNNGSTLGSIYVVDSAEIRLPIQQQHLSHLNLPEIYRDSNTETVQIPVKISAEIGSKTHLWDGHIARVEGTIDSQTRQLYVVAEVEDPYKFRQDGTPPLKIGQFVNVLIKGNELNNVVVLPRKAVTPAGNINVIEAGILQRKSVTPLWKDSHDIVIENDFNNNQHISISPLGNVVSGTRVEFLDSERAINNNMDELNKKEPS
ncbi:MAG: efflux RND transporter periplasmic adaptor subunit [Marinicellaceae bacterium]